MDIVNDVYQSLKDNTREVQKVAEEKRTLEKKIKNNVYSAETINKKIMPCIADLRQKLESMKNQSISSAKELVNNFRREVDAENNLDPQEITDDIKLLSSGLPLTERDIETIIKRNENNRTMNILALRYAAQHDLKIDNRSYSFELNQKRALETADALDQILGYYSKWIDTEKALYMLDKFFGMK